MTKEGGGWSQLWLKAFGALAEDPGSTPDTTHWQLVASPREFNTLF